VLDRVDDDRAHDSSACAAGAAADASAPSAAGSDSSFTGATSASAGSPLSDVADASAPAPLAAFLAGAFFFLAVVASVLGPPSASASAALNRSSLLGLGSLTFSVPSVPG